MIFKKDTWVFSASLNRFPATKVGIATIGDKQNNIVSCEQETIGMDRVVV